MSVDRNEYVIIGYKFDNDLQNKNGDKLGDLIWEDNRFLPMSEGWKGEEFTIVAHGMSSNYVVFGKTIATGDKYSGIEMVQIDFEKIDLSHIRNRAIDLFSEFDLKFDSPKIIAFSHYH